jgi:hypothetical protein
MNLVHMLIEVQKRKAQLDKAEEFAKMAAVTKHYEELLAQLSLRATRMIEENFSKTTGIDEGFGKDGMDVLPPFPDFLHKREEPTEYVLKKDAREAWDKFEDGWRKAAINVSIVTKGGTAFVRFSPILR